MLRLLFFLTALTWTNGTVLAEMDTSDRSSTVVVLPLVVEISGVTEDVSDVLRSFLEEELARAGVGVLERRHLEHLLDEHRLAEAGRTAFPGIVETGRLLGAGFLIKSRLYGNDPDAFQLTSRLVNTETGEVAGVFTETLSLDVGTISERINHMADAMADHLQPVLPASRSVEWRASPEARLFLHRGINACARGWPEAGLGFFLAARAVEPDWLEAQLWEYQAYRLAAFDDHAELVRKRLSEQLDIRDLDGLIASGEEGDRPTDSIILSILPPLLVSDHKEDPDAPPIDADELHALLKAVALENERIRLFEPSLFAETTIEMDLGLDHRFDRRNLPRHGRKLIVDGWLFTRVETSPDGPPRLRYELRDPLSGRRLALHEPEDGELNGPSVARSLEALLSEWDTAGMEEPQTLPKDLTEPLPWEDKEALRNPRSKLVSLLNKIRLKKDLPQSRFDLSEHFRKWVFEHDLHEHARLERHLLVQDLEPGHPLEAFWLYRVAFPQGAMQGAPDPDFEQAVWDRLEKVIEENPQSLVATASWYRLGQEAYSREDWDGVLDYMPRVVEGLSFPSAKIHSSRPSERVAEQQLHRARNRFALASHIALAQAWKAKEDPERAQLHYERVRRHAAELSGSALRSVPHSMFLDLIEEGIPVLTSLGGSAAFRMDSELAVALSGQSESMGEWSYRKVLEPALAVDQESLSADELFELRNEMLRGIRLYVEYLHSNAECRLTGTIFPSQLSSLVLEGLRHLRDADHRVLDQEEWTSLLDEVAGAMRIYLGLDQLDWEKRQHQDFAPGAFPILARLYSNFALYQEAFRQYEPLFQDHVPLASQLKGLHLAARQPMSSLPATYFRHLHNALQRASREGVEAPYDLHFVMARKEHEGGALQVAAAGYETVIAKLRRRSMRPDFRLSAKYFLAEIYFETGKPARAAACLRTIVEEGAGHSIYLRRDAGNVLSRGPTLVDLAAKRLSQIRPGH